MLKQNWFGSSNMEMFNEYYDVQKFYDKDTKAIYVVEEDLIGHITITEFQEHHEGYVENYNEYLEWKSQNLPVRLFIQECERYVEKCTEEEMSKLYETTVDITMCGLTTKIPYGAEPHNRILDALRILLDEGEVE